MSYMPGGMDEFSCLSVLTAFYVGGNGEQCIGGLKELKGMRSLHGVITIVISKSYAEKDEENDSDGGYLANLDQLKSICIQFPDSELEKKNERQDGLLGKLQPHPNVRRLVLKYYKGGEIGRWGTPQHNWASILPNLVRIYLIKCKWLRHLPVLSQLQHLKKLELSELGDVEYMEETEEQRTSGDSASSQLPFFPSLESLDINEMKKLKGWWRRRAGSNDDFCHPPSFPSLSKLSIDWCPNLLSFPDCPTLETLGLNNVNERMRLSSSSNPSVKTELLQLREVTVNNVAHLKALPPCHPHTIYIHNNLVEEVFKTSIFSSLQTLAIVGCRELKSLPRGMQYLTSLQHLSILQCGNIEGIPEWISCLSSLQSLRISCCDNIKSMPEAMRNITSLQRLEIYRCSKEIKERCQDPDGEDWPKIKHIPNVSIRMR